MHAIQALATHVVNKLILIYACQQQSANNSSSAQTTAFNAGSVQPWITSICRVRKSGGSSAPSHCAFLRRQAAADLAYLLISSSSCKFSPTRCEGNCALPLVNVFPKERGRDFLHAVVCVKRLHPASLIWPHGFILHRLKVLLSVMWISLVNQNLQTLQKHSVITRFRDPLTFRQTVNLERLFFSPKWHIFTRRHKNELSSV